MTGEAVTLSIREPRDSEVAICRMLIPEACRDPAQRCFRLAFEPTGQVAGALSYRDEGTTVGSLRLHVVNNRRRSGIGSQLVNYALEATRTFGRSRVRADIDLMEEPAAEPFLVANGFERTGRLTSAGGLMADVTKHWPELRAKVNASVGLPPGTRIVGIQDAPMDQVVRLCSEYISNRPALTGLQRTFRPDQLKESVVIMVDDKIVGLMLGELVGDVMKIPAWVVVPEYRGKMIGNLLRVETIDRVMDRAKSVQFEFFDTAPATAKLTTESGYVIVGVRGRYERSVS